MSYYVVIVMPIALASAANQVAEDWDPDGGAFTFSAEHGVRAVGTHAMTHFVAAGPLSLARLNQLPTLRDQLPGADYKIDLPVNTALAQMTPPLERIPYVIDMTPTEDTQP